MSTIPLFYQQPKFLIDGEWVIGSGGVTHRLVNPATGLAISEYQSASTTQLDAALGAVGKSFPAWRTTPAAERGRILRQGAALMRQRVEEIATLLTTEQGKPLAEARAEILATAEMFEWFAEEAVRAYGRIVPPRASNLRQHIVREAVGPVAMFCSWNFPARNPGYKIAAALAAGCPCIVKPAEETPLTAMALGLALMDAGLPKGVLNLVYGDAANLSAYLIASSVIRKISFTGSTQVGKILSSLAANTVKKMTMELGGHAPVIVFDDANLDLAVSLTAAAKFRNAGQVCISPTRFFVQAATYQSFIDKFAAVAAKQVVGNGLDTKTNMGPLVHERRRNDVDKFVQDAIDRGARCVLGGAPIDGAGFFYPTTLIADLPEQSRLLHEEPFGPVASVVPFDTIDDVIVQANALPFGLAAYAFTTSLRTAHDVADRIESGMVGINTTRISYPETPFGGVKESGYGSEGGIEGLDAYLVTKSVSLAL
ncbi:MAG: NAD-dependent succinate-semialdehyde dehydrogenase [Betaproteobacteria bacterium]